MLAFPMNLWQAIKDPLQGKASLNRVFWLYGVLGSVLVTAIGLLLDAGNVFVMRLYTVLGLLFSIYITVATFQCAGNCRSKILARLVRISAVISLVAIALLAYLEFTGALDLALISVGGEQ